MENEGKDSGKVKKQVEEKPKVEVLIIRHKQLFEMLKRPDIMWRVLLSLFCVIVVLFVGLAFVVISIKSFYPYNSIRTNLYGATIMENEDTEISYWLFNTAELWANSGIEVKKGDVLTIRASGASHTAIHHLVEDAGSNKTLRDKWVGTGGTRPTGSTRDKYRREYRIARNLPEGILLMGVADMDYEDSENGYGIDSLDIYVIGEERRDLVIREDGVLRFAVNDIVLDNATIDDMYVANLRKLLENSGVTLPEDSVVRNVLEQTCGKDSAKAMEKLEKWNGDWFPGRDNEALKTVGFELGEYPDSANYGKHYPVINELVYYRRNGFSNAWFVDNVGSFLVVIERKKTEL